MEHVDMKVWYGTDFDLTANQYKGDHAGKYEISTLLYIRPDLVNVELKHLESESDSGGKFALGVDAHEASVEYGERILRKCVETLCNHVEQAIGECSANDGSRAPLSYSQTERIWNDVIQQKWKCLHPRDGQEAVSAKSRWKPQEHCPFQ